MDQNHTTKSGMTHIGEIFAIFHHPEKINKSRTRDHFNLTVNKTQILVIFVPATIQGGNFGSNGMQIMKNSRPHISKPSNLAEQSALQTRMLQQHKTSRTLNRRRTNLRNPHNLHSIMREREREGYLNC